MRSYCCLVLLLLAAGCRTLSPEQREMVWQFADKSEKFPVTPVNNWIVLADIREYLGIYHALFGPAQRQPVKAA
jgi:hypothetical protein